MTRQKLLTASLMMLAARNSSIAAAQQHLDIDAYGSIRTQVETVRPDNRSELDAYEAVRDAYSRVGIKADYAISDGLEVFGQIEIPLDTANLKVQDSYDQGGFGRSSEERLRIAQIGLLGDVGTLAYGQQWMPYYSAIASPVDMFSTYYSGFATYTVFRVRNTLAYYSPDWQGFSFAASHSGDDGNLKSTSRIDDRRVQFTASYAFGDTRFSAGVDDRGDVGTGRNRIVGFAASHRMGGLYLAAKHETFDTGNTTPGQFSTDGNRAINLFASYTLGKNTFKLMLARVENYGENIVHLGIDHPFRDDLKFFAEYYQEQETAAITQKRGGLDGFDSAVSGGRVFATGLRYDF